MAAASAVFCTGAVVAAGATPAALADTARAQLAGTAAPAQVQVQGGSAVAPSTAVKFDLVMKLRDPLGAALLVRAVSDPSSALYKHYLTAAQWEARFSPTAATIAQAEQWLTSQGFTVGGASKDGITISASGTAAQVESAFDTTLANYSVAGHTERMASTELSVPTSLAGVITGAMGINQTIATPADAGSPDIPGSTDQDPAVTRNASSDPPAPSAFLTHGPCSSSFGALTTTENPPFGNGYPATVPDTVCGYKPAQLRSAYGLTAANTGAGETIAIIDAYDSSTIASDASRYFADNDPSEPFSAADFTQIDQTPFDDESECAASGWQTEEAIDIESAHSMAPDAHILYVGAQDCVTGLYAAEQTVIDNGLANVISNSWADTGGDLLDDVATRTAVDDLFMLADATGITVQYSSGDDGDNFALIGVSAADYPASSPFVTAVGGTTLAIGADGQRTAEYGWQTGHSFLCTANIEGDYPGCTAATAGTWLPVTADGSSGGFTSYNYAQPFYQAGVVPDALAERNAAFNGTANARVVPDISLEADPATGFLIGLHQTLPDGLSLYTETRYGGTSLASPLLAGIVADADQASGTPLGFINPALYKMDTADPSSIEDIVPNGDLGQARTDFAGDLGLGLNNGTTYATGTVQQFREIGWQGMEVYCDGTGNCASRPETQTTAIGYDSLTGLGAPGQDFIGTLAAF